MRQRNFLFVPSSLAIGLHHPPELLAPAASLHEDVERDRAIGAPDSEFYREVAEEAVVYFQKTKDVTAPERLKSPTSRNATPLGRAL